MNEKKDKSESTPDGTWLRWPPNEEGIYITKKKKLLNGRTFIIGWRKVDNGE